MSDMEICFRWNPNTGKWDIIIKLSSDPDALPIEHEQMHKALAEKLVGIKFNDLGEIIVERENPNQNA